MPASPELRQLHAALANAHRAPRHETEQARAKRLETAARLRTAYAVARTAEDIQALPEISEDDARVLAQLVLARAAR